MVAVGAAFKIVSGKIKGPPPWITQYGLEWMWRFAQEPGKLWRRAMIYGPQFAGHALLDLTGFKKYD
jgi:N-acetylglucosaminyldiphosphoundecaprenol N-acetyl-beta-D-mannosaminyltransferase